MNVYDGIQKELLQMQQTLRNLTGNPSDVTSKILGDFYEDIIREVTRNYIPPKFEIYTGLIVKLTPTKEVEKVSKELDIIIVDGTSSFPLFLKNNLIITTPDSVKAVIQVKSVLSTRNVENAKINLESVKIIKNIPTALIGYKRILNPATIVKKVGNFIDKVIYFSNSKFNLEPGQFEAYIDFLDTYLKGP